MRKCGCGMCRMWRCLATSKSRRRPFNRSANRKCRSRIFQWAAGSTESPRGHALKNVFLRMEQFRLARMKRRLSLARQRSFMEKSGNHRRSLLMQKPSGPPEVVIGKAEARVRGCVECKFHRGTCGIEARRRAVFPTVRRHGESRGRFAVLGLPVENTKQRTFNFNFNNRNRRPPTDRLTPCFPRLQHVGERLHVGGTGRWFDPTSDSTIAALPDGPRDWI